MSQDIIITQKSALSLPTDKPEGFICGYASKFGGIDSYDDTIERNAYDNIIKGAMPKMFFNHQSWDTVPIGNWTKWDIDNTGLYVEGQLNMALQSARDVYEGIKFGSIDGMSVSIRMSYDDFWYDDDGIRHIKNVQSMREISVVTFPADDAARIINFKSGDMPDFSSVRDVEHYLRDSGFSRSQAVAFISKAKSAFSNERQRDAEDQELSNISSMLDNIIRKL